MPDKAYRSGLCALGLIATTACARGRQSSVQVDSALTRPSVVHFAQVASLSTAPDSGQAEAILRFLKRLAPPPDSAFNDSLVASVPLDSLLALVSDSGLVSNDVNEGADSSVSLSRDEVRRQFEARRGRAFSQLGHLAYIAIQPYPQYSKLSFVRSSGALDVAVGGWYVLTYVCEQGRTRLRRVSYEEFEGE